MVLSWSAEAQNIRCGLYRHYKGALYRVLGVVRHTETLEELVIYQALDGSGLCWARPLGMFCEMVIVDGEPAQSRFCYVE